MTGDSTETLARVDAHIVALRQAEDDDARDAIGAQLLELALGPEGTRVRQHLDDALKSELLEVQWAIEDVLQAATPAVKPAAPEPAPEPEPEPEVEDDPNRPLTAADLTMVYDDPRGLVLHKTKVGDRWFATQVDPATRQPQTFELHPTEIQQLQTQLAGSPYWLVGG